MRCGLTKSPKLSHYNERAETALVTSSTDEVDLNISDTQLSAGKDINDEFDLNVTSTSSEKT